MGSCSFLAATLDVEMLHRSVTLPRTPVAPATTPVSDPSYLKSGFTVAHELGGRYLLRYLLDDQTDQFLDGSTRRHWVTPTAYKPSETITWLALPTPGRPRNYALLLRPDRIDKIWGPRWVRFGHGIEYILPNGFTDNALAQDWPLEVR